MIDYQKIPFIKKFSLAIITGFDELEKLAFLGLYSFLQIISNKEVIKTHDSIQSIQQYHSTGSKAHIGGSIDNNLMATPTTSMRGTGDQMIEEVRIINSKITQINLLSSVIPPKNINVSLGGLNVYSKIS